MLHRPTMLLSECAHTPAGRWAGEIMFMMLFASALRRLTSRCNQMPEVSFGLSQESVGPRRHSALRARRLVQDSDRFWRVTPPARRSLERMLDESEAELALSWAIVRNAPLESKHGGPLCQGTRQVTLSGSSRNAVLDVLQVHQPIACFPLAHTIDVRLDGLTTYHPSTKGLELLCLCCHAASNVHNKPPLNHAKCKQCLQDIFVDTGDGEVALGIAYRGGRRVRRWSRRRSRTAQRWPTRRRRGAAARGASTGCSGSCAGASAACAPTLGCRTPLPAARSETPSPATWASRAATSPRCFCRSPIPEASKDSFNF